MDRPDGVAHDLGVWNVTCANGQAYDHRYAALGLLALHVAYLGLLAWWDG